MRVVRVTDWRDATLLQGYAFITHEIYIASPDFKHIYKINDLASSRLRNTIDAKYDMIPSMIENASKLLSTEQFSALMDSINTSKFVDLVHMGVPMNVMRQRNLIPKVDDLNFLYRSIFIRPAFRMQEFRASIIKATLVCLYYGCELTEYSSINVVVDVVRWKETEEAQILKDLRKADDFREIPVFILEKVLFPMIQYSLPYDVPSTWMQGSVLDPGNK